MPPNAILYLPGSTQIVGVSTHISPSIFVRSSDSTATSGSYREIVSPGWRVRLIGTG
jgi:hypothetical protein